MKNFCKNPQHKPIEWHEPGDGPLYETSPRTKKQNKPAGWHNPDDEHLYQTNPWPKDPDWLKEKHINYSATSSLESYPNWARKEAFCLLHNGRRPNFILQLNLQRPYFRADIPNLKKELDSLFAYLRRKKKIVAYAVIETTRNEYKTGPSDKVHIHFLIDTELAEGELKNLFHRACKSAKYTPDDYRISKVKSIAGISDNEYKYRICNYIVKDGFPDKIILFKRGLGFRKIRTIGKFWVDSAGRPTTKEKIWSQASQKMKK